MRSEEGLILLAEDGSVLWANLEAANLLGYARSELHDLALPVIGEEEGGSSKPIGPVATAFKNVLAGDTKESEGEARFPRKDDKRVAVHWKLWALPSQKGRKQILLSISETAQASTTGPIVSGYRDVFEYAVEGIFRSTIEGRYIEVNPALARMYGYSSPAELITGLHDIGTQLYVNPHRRTELVQSLLSHGFVRGFEAELYKADGTTMWCAAFARTVLSADQTPLYIEGSVIDITERKKAEEALKRSETQLRELAARNQQVREEERMSVAREIHDELGQALTLLKIDLTWLGGRLISTVDEEVRKPLEEKIGAMEQMIHWTLRTVRRILSTLRPPLLDESGLKEAIEFHLHDFSKRVAIRYELEASPLNNLPQKPATAVFRIFQEILTNIARHANASRVKVHLSETNSQFVMKVQDNGCGITQERLTHSRNFGLLGMHERALAIGGEVEILGSPRSGTTVILRIPITNTPATVKPKPPEPKPTRALQESKTA